MSRNNRIINMMIDCRMIPRGSLVIAGVSGGPDSLCMLHALHQLADILELTIVPVHVNHGLRPEADEEESNVVRICERFGLDCYTYLADCRGIAEEECISIEEAGRQIRYEIFDDTAQEFEENGVPRENIRIAVAHNADDQAETVLMHLIRGTGPHGLAGIPSMRMSDKGYRIVRPLINVPRSDIEQYIEENKLHPNIDKSNRNNDYTRNRIRNELIPYLEKNFNPAIRAALCRYANLADLDDSLLTDLAMAQTGSMITTDPEKDTLTLDITEIKDNPIPLLSRTAGCILSTLGLDRFISFDLVGQIVMLISSDKPSGRVDLPGGFRAYREYDKVIFTQADEDEMTGRPDPGISILPDILLIRDYHPDEYGVHAVFDFDAFNNAYPGRVGDIMLRTRREGDFIPMKEGRKKIQDLFVDSKVPKFARDSILMAAIGSEVLWILPGEWAIRPQERTKGRFSPKYHITETTERVLLIELENDI